MLIGAKHGSDDEATENIRQQLYEKNLALQSELAKENPNIAKASELQNVISTLQSDFDQRRLACECGW